LLLQTAIGLSKGVFWYSPRNEVVINLLIQIP